MIFDHSVKILRNVEFLKSFSLGDGKSSLSVIHRIFFIFGNLSIDGSNKLDSYKEKVCKSPVTGVVYRELFQKRGENFRVFRI